MYFLKFLYIITTGQYYTTNQELSKIYETRTILDTVSIVSLTSFIGTLVFFHEDVVRLSSIQFLSVLLLFYVLLCLKLYLNYRKIAKEQKENQHKSMKIEFPALLVGTSFIFSYVIYKTSEVFLISYIYISIITFLYFVYHHEYHKLMSEMANFLKYDYSYIIIDRKIFNEILKLSSVDLKYNKELLKLYGIDTINVRLKNSCIMQNYLYGHNLKDNRISRIDFIYDLVGLNYNLYYNNGKLDIAIILIKEKQKCR